MTRDSGYYIERLLSFSDPSELGRAIAEFGWTCSEEISTLLDIVRNEKYSPAYRIAAIRELRSIIERTSHAGGLVADVTVTTDGRRSHVKLVKKAVSTIKEMHGNVSAPLQLPGTHFPPRERISGIATAGSTATPAVSAAFLSEDERGDGDDRADPSGG